MYQETPQRLGDVKQERETTEEAARLRLLFNGTVCSLQPLFLVGAGIFPSTGCFEMSTFVFTEPTALPLGIPAAEPGVLPAPGEPCEQRAGRDFLQPFQDLWRPVEQSKEALV